MDEVSITETAAQQVKKSAVESQTDNLPLRIAVTVQPNGSFHYGMGFDDVGNANGEDINYHSNGIDIVIAKTSYELLKGTVVDYAELEPKQFHFVFLNPNDPNYKPNDSSKD
ncbi:MAG: iron-sulfur cluster biosynthesis family protein [Gammaproteobacteria bacterium]|nr:iron-sulfur cluster biosynthesis family protein [Gammaproteobacteria bacterium]